jgi:hypothetical protein
MEVILTSKKGNFAWIAYAANDISIGYGNGEDLYWMRLGQGLCSSRKISVIIINTSTSSNSNSSTTPPTNPTT